MDLVALFADVKSVLRRRWLLLVAPMMFGTFIAAVVAAVLPPIYQSTARILVESQQIPSDLVRTTVTAEASERIQLIQQRILTRENLIELADRHRVFARRDDMSPTAVVDAMREAITIQQVTLGSQRARRGAPASATALNIVFQADTPQKAARVANDIVDQVLQLNLQTRGQTAVATLDFFTREVERMQGELRAKEREISNFKQANQTALPESLGQRRAELATLSSRRFDLAGRRASLEEEKRGLEQSLAIGAASLTEGGSPLQQELVRLQRALLQQRAIYSETHPQIRALISRIRALESALGTVAMADTDRGEVEQQGVAAQTLQQIERLEAQLDLLDAQERDDQARIAELEQSILRTPEVEVTLAALQRDYSALQVQFQDAALKRAQAAIGERLEVNRQAERFEVIEPALAPARPSAPNRPIIVAAGFVGSSGVGFALVALIELLNRRLRSPRDFETRLQMRPIVTIPYIRTDRERLRRRLVFVAWLVILLAAVPATLLAIDQYFMPLDLLAQRIVDGSGISRLVNLIEARFGN